MASACITPLGAADNVRTRAEWTYVGMPDLGSLSKRAILVEWQTFPDQTVNPRFPERLGGELGALGVKLDDDLFFICRSGGRSLAAAKAMAAMGYRACHNVAGGFEGALVRDAVLFGARNRDGWGIGLTILTALAKLIPSLPEEETYLALYKGISRVARDCDGAAPRRDRLPLAPSEYQPLPVLQRWFRHWTRVRHRDAAERTLLTAIASGASSIELAALMLIAVTDRYFADGGHALDFTNKAFESLEIIGWEHAAAMLPSVVDQMVSARGNEESNAWRQPIDLVPMCEAA